MVSELRDIPRPMLETLYRAQGARLQELQALVDEQARQLTELREEVARLQRRLSRNSRNSSMPPSTDGTLPGSPPPELPDKPPATRRRGRQRGAPGSALRWTAPTTVVDHRPAGC